MKLNNLCIKAIKKYQESKPFGKAPRCVHIPTCSNYGLECYEKFNFFKASLLTSKRILLCTPLNKKVFDPVPLSKGETEELKNLYRTLNISFIDYLNKYPLSNADDLIIHIFESIEFIDNVDYLTKLRLIDLSLKLLKKTIIKKELPLNKKESLKLIKKTYHEGLTKPEHSKKYIDNYLI